MKYAQNNRVKPVRANHHITAPQVRLVAEEGGASEVLSLSEALNRAGRAELDLVEVVPNAKPPVVKIMDFGKWQYEQKIRRKKEQKKVVSHKEIHLRYCIGQHDLQTKVRALKQFLEEKRQVRLVMKFKNRELGFRQLGEQVIDRIVREVTDVGELQNRPRLEGRNLVVNVVPK